MTDDRLISALQQPQLFDHRVEAFELIETHISQVLLTGPCAYKLRKPVDFGFLDFTTLQQRFDDCCHELTLNRRFSPELYIGLIRISGTLQQPRLEPTDPQQPFDPNALDYAVKMVQFPQDQLLSERHHHQQLPEAALERLATELAAIHAAAPNRPTDASLGSPDTVGRLMMQNFAQIRPYLGHHQDQHSLLAQLNRLQQTTETALARHRSLLTERHRQGHIRECHGDLHLGNIALFNGRACPFDCIEFNPRYRWLDPMSDLAFLLMDLQFRGQSSLANRLLNQYLEQNLDYAGLPLLPLYQAYRAMVRAKVTLLTSGPSDQPLAASCQQQCRAYVELAERLLTPRPGRLILMHGVSGSGKSWLSQQLIRQRPAEQPANQQRPWIRLRSDLVRQQLHQQPANQQQPRYSAAMDHATYQRLLDDAEPLLRAGMSVIIDAAFLQQQQRQPFLALAQQLEIKPILLCCSADPTMLAHRIEQRLKQGEDPSEATVGVLRQQLANRQPLLPHEQACAQLIDSTQTKPLQQLLIRLGAG